MTLSGLFFNIRLVASESVLMLLLLLKEVLIFHEFRCMVVAINKKTGEGIKLSPAVKDKRYFLLEVTSRAFCRYVFGGARLRSRWRRTRP